MSWRKNRLDKREVDWPEIKKQLEKVGTVDNIDILDLDHVEFIVNGVKISFYANPNYSPVKQEIPFINNIKLADACSIGAMKMEVLLRRSKFRDYYDIYSLLLAGENIYEMIEMALKYSGHRLKSKNLLSILTRSDRFLADSNFQALCPVYDVTSAQIEAKIKEALTLNNNQTSPKFSD